MPIYKGVIWLNRDSGCLKVGFGDDQEKIKGILREAKNLTLEIVLNVSEKADNGLVKK